MAALTCPVRACGAVLAPGGKAVACERGHSFDVGRSGYVNLLQPQDKRSSDPGDSRDAVAARRRILDSGLEAWLVDEVVRCVAGLRLAPRSSVLDVGCGEGTVLAAIADAVDVDAHGVDISRSAIDAAARRHPRVTWVIANADRSLPFADGTFMLVTSITARRNAREMCRVLAASGRLLVAVPGPDDLAELREAVMGHAARDERWPGLLDELSGSFDLESRRELRSTSVVPRALLLDLLATTYRGARASQQDRVARLPDEMTLTSSRLLGWFRPRDR